MSISAKNSKKIFVRRVPYLSTREDIENIFYKYGPIVYIKFWSFDNLTPELGLKTNLTSVACEFILKDLWSFQQFVTKKGYNELLGIPIDKLQNDDWMMGWIASQNSIEVCIEYQDYRDANNAKKDLSDGKIKMGQVYLSVGVEK